MGVDPVSMAVIGAVGLGATSSIVSAASQKGASEYNAAVAKQEAIYAKKKAKVDERAYRRDLERRVGSAQMVAGSTGFGAGGTNADLIDQIRKEGEIDAAMVRHGGEVSSWSSNAQAGLYSAQGSSYQTAGIISAGSTLLGGLAKSGVFKKKSDSSSWLG